MADAPTPPPLDALARRLPELPVPPSWAGRLGNAVLLVVVSGLAGLALSPGLSSQQIPVLKPEDVGKPFRASSPSGFKAGRDYEIPDRATTDQRREESRAAVRPVYDFNPAAVNEIKKSV